MENLINTDSVVVASDAYIEGLHIKYDFYMNVIGIAILCGVGLLIVGIFTNKNKR